MEKATSVAKYRYQRLLWATAPLRAYFRPRFFGIDHLDPARPSLFIGNRPLSAIDYPLMASEIVLRKGIVLCPLADRAHLISPIRNRLLQRLGVVEDTPENSSRLMREGRHIAAFPPLRRERGRQTIPLRGDAHSPIWKQGAGVAAMAIRHGYRIIPFASKGADQAYDILLDGRDIMASPLGKLLDVTGLSKVLRADEWFPTIVRGVGPTMIPRPERFCFAFGEPIETTRHAGRHDDEEALFALRREVEEALLRQIKILLFLQDSNKEQSLWRRLLCRL